MRRFLLTLLLSLAFLQLAHGQDAVTVDKGIYVVEYSQKFEQPLKVTYRATNPTQKVIQQQQTVPRRHEALARITARALKKRL